MKFLTIALTIAFCGSFTFGQKTLCVGSLTLAHKFDRNKGINDAQRDGLVTNPEIFNDFKNNYDIDKDGCVSRAEWVYRWVSYYGFTPDFAKYFVDNGPGRSSPSRNPNEKCLTNYANLATRQGKGIPINTLVSGNVQSLIDFCQADQSRYDNNCDCSQLKDLCLKNPDYLILPPCAAYNQGTINI